MTNHPHSSLRFLRTVRPYVDPVFAAMAIGGCGANFVFYWMSDGKASALFFAAGASLGVIAAMLTLGCFVLSFGRWRKRRARLWRGRRRAHDERIN